MLLAETAYVGDGEKVNESTQQRDEEAADMSWHRERGKKRPTTFRRDGSCRKKLALTGRPILVKLCICECLQLQQARYAGVKNYTSQRCQDEWIGSLVEWPVVVSYKYPIQPAIYFAQSKSNPAWDFTP